MDQFFNRKRRRCRGLLGVLIYCVAVLACVGTNSWGASTSKTETATLSAQEKENLVQLGVEQYQQDDLVQAQSNLERAATVFSENYAVPYYLGLIYLKQGQRSAAIYQWQQYIKMDPDSNNAMRIRKNISLLLLEEARESAQTAVANEADLTRLPADDNTVAIGGFTNLGSEKIGPLGKGISALLIHDLSQVPDLVIVERLRLQALLQEMQLGSSGMVTKETAPSVGKLLKARHVTSGSLADLEEDNLQIASTLMDADEMTSTGTQEAQGELAAFFSLEKQIACQIIEDLGKNCDEAPPEFHKIHTLSLAALMFFGKGLDYLDQEAYVQARDAFQQALIEDPSFVLAQQALLNTPVPEMQFMTDSASVASGTSIGTTEEMIAMAAAHGVSTDAAGTATAVGTTLSAGASGGVGVLGTAGIIAGAAVVTGAAVAIGGSSGGDDDPSSGGGGSGTPTNVTDAVENDFVGTFQATRPDATFDQWHAQLTFNNGGTGSWVETINGTSSTGSLTWSFVESTDRFSFRTDTNAQFSGTAQGNTNNFSLTGTWSGGSPGTINFTR